MWSSTTPPSPPLCPWILPNRELPIIRKIAIGSIRNKLLIILPVAMILSQFLPQALPYLLIAGGLFLCFEGAEKVYEAITGGHHGDEDTPVVLQGPELEKVWSAAQSAPTSSCPPRSW